MKHFPATCHPKYISSDALYYNFYARIFEMFVQNNMFHPSYIGKF